MTLRDTHSLVARAKIIGLANAGGDTINSIKQASKFGIVQGGQKLVGLLIFITDIHALGLKTAQGLVFTDPWYWDQNDANRAIHCGDQCALDHKQRRVT